MNACLVRGLCMGLVFCWVGCGPSAQLSASKNRAAEQVRNEFRTNIIEVRYPNGQLRERFEGYRGKDGDTVIHGHYAMWSDNGTLLLEYECRHGKRHGIYRSYYPSGKLEVESHYVDDVQDGTAVWWYESGQRQREETWVRGVKHGKEILFYENGKIKYEGGYENGLPHGVFHRYYPNGQHEATGAYERGKLVYEKRDF